MSKAKTKMTATANTSATKRGLMVSAAKSNMHSVSSLSEAGDSRINERNKKEKEKAREKTGLKSYRYKDKESRRVLREEQGVARSMLKLSEDLQKSSSPKEQAKLAKAPAAVQKEHKEWWQEVGDFLLKAAPIVLEVVAMLI
jgi:DNA invertase Pin-like site-specific DNA recombinase